MNLKITVLGANAAPKNHESLILGAGETPGSRTATPENQAAAALRREHLPPGKQMATGPVTIYYRR